MTWNWNDDGTTMGTTRDDGTILTARIVPDDDPDFSWLEDEEDPNDYSVWGVILTARTAGSILAEGSVWGVTLLESSGYREARAYIEEAADDLALGIAPLNSLAVLLLPA